MKYREVARKLKALGCEEVKRRGIGSHRKWTNPSNNRKTVFPDWGGRDLKMPTVKQGVVKHLGLSWDNFENA